MRALGRSLVCCFLLLATVASSAAQEIRGRFTGSRSQAPLAAAYVTLIDQAGTAVGTTLTDASGWFVLTAPTPGRYRIRAEYIGYETAQQVVLVPREGTVWVELVAAFQVIELEGLTAEVDQACNVPAAAARRVALLWDEVRKAFQVTAYIEDQGGYRFQVDRWTRTLEPRRLRVTDEVRRPREGMHPGSPFVSLPPARLAADGYIQQSPGSDDLNYYGPDALVLLDRSFQDSHCFGFLAGGPSDGWVGLQFKPRDLRASDIEGTLWIDETTYEPLRLDYRYPVLSWPLVTDKVGGRLEFARIPEGPWIITRWWIRMPVVQEVAYGFSRGAPSRYDLAALIEEGGMVLDVEAGDRRGLTVELGGVEGIVRDSVDGTAIPEATVQLNGTFFEARSGPDGRFQISGVPEGRYEIVARTEELSSLGIVRSGVEVDVAGGAPTEVELRLPPMRVAVAASCQQPLLEDGRGVILGTALDSLGSPSAAAEVEVSWETVAMAGSRGRNRQGQIAAGLSVAQQTTVASVPVRSDGTFTVCGAPLEEEITLRAVAPGYGGPAVIVRLREGESPRIPLTLLPESLAEALVVRVLRPDGREPLEGAEVALAGLGRSAITDASGRAVFTGVPMELLVVGTAHLAYLSRTDTLEVSDEGTTTATVRLTDRAFELEPMVVEVGAPEARARRVSAASGSIVLAQVDIREIYVNARADNVAEVLRDALPNGVRISPIATGSNYVGTCIESTRGSLNSRKMPGFCAMVQVVVDGGYLTTQEAARLVESFPLSEIVSIEFLSPMDQTFRYGTSRGNGMLIITTARR